MATVPSQRTWVTGETVTAAEMNSNVRDATNFLIGGSAGQRPTFSANNFVSQNYTTGVTASQTFSAVGRDTDSGWSSPTYTVQTAGIWLWTANVQWANNGTGTRSINIAGMSQPYQSVSAAVDPLGRAAIGAIGLLSASQTVSVSLTQTSGGNLGTAAGNTAFSGVWLGN